MARTVPFGAYALAVDEAGTRGSPVVLVHSTGMTSRQWKRLAERLAGSHRVLLPDLIGYGASSPWPRGEPFHWTLDVAGVEALLDALGEPAHLVGHSYGGLVALTAALHRPRLVRSLALAEPVAFGVLHAPGAAPEGELDALGSMPHRDAQVLPEAPGAGEAWLEWFVDYWNGPGAFSALPERMKAAFRATDAVCFGEVWSLLSDRTTAAVWSTVRAPALFVRGERSPRAARRVVDLLAAALPATRGVHDVAGAGHLAPVTHADEVAEAIARHIDAHDAG